MLPISLPVNPGNAGISPSVRNRWSPRPVDWTKCQPSDRFCAIPVDYTAGIATSRALSATSKPSRYLWLWHNYCILQRRLRFTKMARCL